MSVSRPHSTMVGEVLGNYRVTDALDSGGMGSVYRAEHTHLGRPAAIKLLKPELTTNDEIVQRFFNEAKAATAIRHPGIVEVYDFGYTQDGRAYFVMELLDGEPLGKRLAAQGGRMSELDAARIARNLANVLKAAHAKGIVHRDLKPDNIFLVPDDDGDRVKVLDFGVAKLVDVLPAEVRHTQTGALMGTPLYMAPEQARAAGMIDHRADLYSLGCILYELIAGTPPFLAEGAGEIIALQLFTPPQPLRERLADVSPEIETIVMKLLEKEAGDRYQTAAEVAAALGAAATKLSNRVSAELPNAGATAPRFTYSPGGSKQLTVPVRGQILDERPTELAPAKKSSMPIVAAVVTLLLAGGVAVFAVARSSGDDPQPAATAPADAGSGSATVAAPPAKPEPPRPAPVKQAPIDDITAMPNTSAPPSGGAADDTGRKKPVPRNAGTTGKKPEVPAGVPVTRPDVEPLEPPPPEATEVRTPIMQRPVETSLDEKPTPPDPPKEP